MLYVRWVSASSGASISPIVAESRSYVLNTSTSEREDSTVQCVSEHRVKTTEKSTVKQRSTAEDGGIRVLSGAGWET